MNTTNDTLYKTWEFLGLEIKPLTNARKFHLTKLVDFTKITPWDIAVLIHALVCDEKTLIKALRNAEFFDEQVSKWINDGKIDMSHFNEESLSMIKEIMEHSDTNKVIPITDPSMTPDPVMGNG